MTAFRLKKGEESFEVVDGPHAGKKFKRGVIYPDRPYQLRGHFEEVPAAEKKAESAIKGE